MPRTKVAIELDLYLRVIDMSAADAQKFIGTDQTPVDLGPADPRRFKRGARIWGFPTREETAEEKAYRIWSVAADREVV